NQHVDVVAPALPGSAVRGGGLIRRLRMIRPVERHGERVPSVPTVARLRHLGQRTRMADSAILTRSIAAQAGQETSIVRAAAAATGGGGAGTEIGTPGAVAACGAPVGASSRVMQAGSSGSAPTFCSTHLAASPLSGLFVL